MIRKMLVPMLLSLVATGSTLAQESASFKLNEHVFNAGGHRLSE